MKQIEEFAPISDVALKTLQDFRSKLADSMRVPADIIATPLRPCIWQKFLRDHVRAQ